MKKNEQILLALILCISALAIIGMTIYKNNKVINNAKVIVSISGQEEYSFNLEEDGIHKIETDAGYNEIEIKDKSVVMKDANCPDKLCIHQGKIDTDMETIVCLPHKLIVEIRSDKVDEVDIIR